jgi:LCP family protein required for cell wall assembly
MSSQEEPYSAGDPARAETAHVGTLTRRQPGDGTGRDNTARRGRRGGRGSSGQDWPPRAGKAARKGGPFGRHPVLSIVALVMTVIVTGAMVFFYVLFRNVYDSIHHVNVNVADLGKRPPELSPGALNILMIGSDSRAGTHGYGNNIVGSRSDTAMVLHITPDHSHAYVVSFPRDSMVPIFACTADGQGHPGQQAAPGQLERLNATFSYGGVACLWKTLEQTTRIHIDHFMQVDFNGFKKIVNDLGGVSVCVPYAIHDWRSHLKLTAGRHTVDGAQALAFVRLRHIGEGSDLQRIQRQQLFLASVAQKMKHSSVIGNPTEMYSLVHDVASSLTTDSGLSLTDLYAIANSLKGLSTSALRFISVPVVPYSGDPLAEVQWQQPQASQLFAAIAHDNHIAKAAKNAKNASKSKPGSATAAKQAKKLPTVSPSKVTVQVLNGTNTTGLAGTTAAGLTGKGFKVTGAADAASSNYTSTYIEYSSASQLPQVNTLSKEIVGAQVKQVPTLPPGQLTLVLGSSFKGLGVKPAAAKKKPSVSSVAGQANGISGNANICGDSSAFAGPDTPTG